MHTQKNDEGFSVIETLIILIVLGLIVFAGWYIPGKQPAVVTPSQNATTGTSAQQAVINDLAQQVADKYSSASADTSAWMGEMGTGAAVPADGYDFNISTQNFPSVVFGQKDSLRTPLKVTSFNEKVNGIIGEVMEANGYKESTDTYTVPGTYDDYTKSVQKPEYTVYTSGEATCINFYDTAYPYTTVSCFTKPDIAAVFTKAKPHVDTYVKANPTIVASNITFGPVTIKSQNGAGVIGSSHEAGYDISEAIFSINNAKKVALYYNHSDGPWTYITQADDEFGFTCGSYTTDTTVRKVMYDQICLSETGQVRLDTNNRALQ